MFATVNLCRFLINCFNREMRKTKAYISLNFNEKDISIYILCELDMFGKE